MRLISLPPGEDAFPLAPGDVIPAEALVELTIADAIRSRSRSLAARRLRDARRQARVMISQGRSRGLAEGLERFAEASERLDRERLRLAERLRPLLLTCLKRILDGLPDDLLIAALLQNVLREYQSDQDIRVMVHPRNRSRFETGLARFCKASRAHVCARVTTDESMSESACLVYVGPDVLDLSVSAMAEEMIEALGLVGALETDDRRRD